MNNTRNILIRYLIAFLVLSIVVIMFSVPAFDFSDNGKHDITYANAAYLMFSNSEDIMNQEADANGELPENQQDRPLAILGILAVLSIAATVSTGILQIIRFIREIPVHSISLGNTVVLIIICLFLRSELSALAGVNLVLLLGILIVILLLTGLVMAIYERSRKSTKIFDKNYSNQLATTRYRKYDVLDHTNDDNVDKGTTKAGTIVGLAGMFKGVKFRIDGKKEIVFGRDVQSCDVVFDRTCALISRRHCTIRFIKSSESYNILDYSKYGTFLQGGQKLVPNSSILLPRGTVIYLGNNQNMFRLE